MVDDLQVTSLKSTYKTNSTAILQAIYNSLKGGLDAKSRQLQSILPPIKTEFEQKYKGRLILAIVESAASTTSDLRRRKPIPNARVSKVVS